MGNTLKVKYKLGKFYFKITVRFKYFPFPYKIWAENKKSVSLYTTGRERYLNEVFFDEFFSRGGQQSLEDYASEMLQLKVQVSGQFGLSVFEGLQVLEQVAQRKLPHQVSELLLHL